MATIINTPGGGDTDAGVSTGLILGIILTIVVVALLIIFRGPIFGTAAPADNTPDRSLDTNVNVNIPLPSGNNGTGSNSTGN